jgi:type I restriction enzyme S subunit
MPVAELVEELAPQRRFHAYPEYQESGVDWLGARPSHWKVRKLKHIASLRTSNVDKKSYEEEQPVRLCNYTDVYYNEQIVANLAFMEATASPEEIAKFSLMKGDVLITKDSEDPNDIAVPACVVDDLERVLCGYHLAQVRAHPTLAHGRYLARAFKASGIRDQFNSRATGITRHGLSKDTIGSSLFLVPPLDEQRAIAAFLDRETARIDELIAKKQRLIELLAEKRTALISHAVTKGLNPKAPLKDTGVEWLGHVPQHWKQKQLKFAITFQRGHDLPSSERVEGTVPVVTSAGPSSWHDDAIATAPGIVTGRYGTIGKFHLVEEDYWPLNTTLYSIDLRGNSPRFLWYMLHVFSDVFLVNSAKSAVPGVDRNDLHPVRVAVPPKSEQEAIVCYLDEQLRRYEELTSDVETAIERLAEYRSALITAAVTGKIDVRNAAVQRSGLAKRLINAAEYLFVREDPESALTPICNAIDRVAKETYGHSGRATYKRFISERMELITRVAFNGTAILNMNFAIPPIHDERGTAIKPHVTDSNGIGLYSFQQIIYHLVRCRLDHDCEVADVLRDSGSGSGQIRMEEHALFVPFDAVALGLLFAVVSETCLRYELIGTVFEHVAWKQVPLIDLVGKKARIEQLSRSTDTGGVPCQ